MAGTSPISLYPGTGFNCGVARDLDRRYDPPPILLYFYCFPLVHGRRVLYSTKFLRVSLECIVNRKEYLAVR